jgi:arylsulfatase A-like enzyme
VTGGEQVGWPDGVVLPPFSDSQVDPKRDIYAIQASRNDPDKPLTQVTVMLVRGQYKLVYFTGYSELKGDRFVQLFDIEADPQELHDLYPAQKVLGDQLLSDLKAKLAEMNKPYL